MTYLGLDKKLGQHHLRSGTLCRPAIEFLAPRRALVVEIGPGGGVLTRELIGAGARVLGIELDARWAFALAQGLGGNAQVVIADALAFAWRRVPRGTRVAGNLPYNVATAIIQQVLPHHERIDRAAFLVQREVADRLVADVGSPAYGALSVLVRAHAEARVLSRVRPGSFHPPPKVESAFVGLSLVAPPLPALEMAPFIATVRQAFAHKRKTLRNALSAGWGREAAESAIEQAGIPDRVRAEELGLESFLDLHRARTALGRDAPPPHPQGSVEC